MIVGGWFVEQPNALDPTCLWTHMPAGDKPLGMAPNLDGVDRVNRRRIFEPDWPRRGPLRSTGSMRTIEKVAGASFMTHLHGPVSTSLKVSGRQTLRSEPYSPGGLRQDPIRLCRLSALRADTM